MSIRFIRVNFGVFFQEHGEVHSLEHSTLYSLTICAIVVAESISLLSLPIFQPSLTALCYVFSIMPQSLLGASRFTNVPAPARTV